MGPSGSHYVEVVWVSTIVIAGHFQAVFPDGARHYDVVDLPRGIVIQYIVCASSCGHTFKCACHADWIMIVISDQRRTERHRKHRCDGE